jgi:signal transduction histidine kinase
MCWLLVSLTRLRRDRKNEFGVHSVQPARESRSGKRQRQFDDEGQRSQLSLCVGVHEGSPFVNTNAESVTVDDRVADTRMGDSRRLSQVVTNLLSNACRYTYGPPSLSTVVVAACLTIATATQGVLRCM